MPVYKMDEGSLHWQFDQCRAPIQFFGGGYGNGKTTAAVVLKALRLARDYPGSNGLIARSTYPKLNDTIRKEFMKWCPKDWIKRMPTIDDNTCYLTNGSIINFRYVAQRGQKNADGSTTSNLLSATYDYVIVDQIEDPEITHKDLLDLMGRLRGSTPYRPDMNGIAEDPTMPSTGPRWLIITSNPTGNWVYTELVKPLYEYKKTGIPGPKLLYDNETGRPIIELFEGSTHINAGNLPKDFIRNMEISFKGQMKDRYLDGKWASYEGLVYPDFDESVHGLTTQQMLQHIRDCLRRHVRLVGLEAYDFGITSPSCWTCGFVDDWGRVFMLDGFYEPNCHYTDQPAMRNKIINKYRHLIDFDDPIRADPSIWKTAPVNKTKNTGETIAELLKGLGWDLKPANNEISAGIVKVSSYLNGLPHIPHPITGVEGAPLLYINTEKMPWWQEEATSYYWKKTTLGTVTDVPNDEKDHAMDNTRYLLSKLPAAADIQVPDHLRPKPWMFWQEEAD